MLVKVDVGFHRCGIDPDRPDAAEVVARIAELPGLNFRGLLSHAGHAYGATSEDETAAVAAAEARLLARLANEVEQQGVKCEEISVGATPTARFSVQQEGLTEMRPGNYVYYDRTQVGLGAAAWSDCALTVLAMVVSTPAPDRIILDCGSKTLSNDMARGFSETRGHGVVFTRPGGDEPRRGPGDRAVVGGACQRAGPERRAPAAHRRSRPRPAEPLLRRVEPG